MHPLDFLQAWYQSHSHGGWEQSHGVTIESLATPGWMVTIDLDGTPLENRPMPAVTREHSKSDWLLCEINRNCFRGQGDPEKLLSIIQVFQNWAESESVPAESATIK